MGVRPEEIELRGVELRDLDLLLAWRQDRAIMRYLPSAAELPEWGQHWEWWRTQAFKDPRDRHQMVVYHWGYTTLDSTNAYGRRVGVVHYDKPTGEVGLIIGEKTLWGQGVGHIALGKLLRIMRSLPAPTPIWAVVHPENTASRRLFESLNFVAAGEGRKGQIKYIWRGWPP